MVLNGNLRIYLYLGISVGCLFLDSKLGAVDQLNVFPAPKGEILSTRFTVSADKTNVPVYQARVVQLPIAARKTMGLPTQLDTSHAAFASIDIGGIVQVTVTSPDPIQSCRILPSSSGITGAISGNSVTFSVSTPGQLTVELNGNWVNSLHFFINPLETNIPNPNDPNVIYFGPGIHYVGGIVVGSGQTVYLAGGAVVYGNPGPVGQYRSIFKLRGDNIVLRGRGVIDGSLIPRGGGSIIEAHGTHVSVEGVILRDSGSWTTSITHSDQLVIQNLKVLGWRGNSDGIDICNSTNVEVSDCFLRTFDDLIVVKTNDLNAGPSQNIYVQRCVLWNEWSNALSVGAECRLPVQDVVFSDCDIIHDKGIEWSLRIDQGDSAAVSNIVFETIRIEESQQLMSLWIGTTPWSKDITRGTISNVIFRQISSVVPAHADVELIGFDSAHEITGVQFDQVLVGGHPLHITQIEQNAFVSDVTVSP